MRKRGLIAIIVLLVLCTSISSFVVAHEDSIEIGDESHPKCLIDTTEKCEENSNDLEKAHFKAEFLNQSSIKIIALCAILIAVITFFAILVTKHTQKYNLALYIAIGLLVVIATFFITYTTLYTNYVSETKGPVHWHADYEVWNCGERLDLIDPTGLNNKVGTNLFHEHGDDRIHVEGVVLKRSDVSLGKYFEVIGGDLHTDLMSYPTEDKGLIKVKNGDYCLDGSIGKINVYVNGKRVDNYEDYVLSPQPIVPPGDCIIIDFSSSDLETTDKLCTSWRVKHWDYENVEALKNGS